MEEIIDSSSDQAQPEAVQVPKLLQILRNDLIREKVSKRLPASTLLSIRGTSKEWNQLLTPDLQKKHSTIKLTTSVAIREYSTFMATSLTIPFAKYEVKYFERGGERDTVIDFFKHYGHTITNLTLRLPESDHGRRPVIRTSGPPVMRCRRRAGNGPLKQPWDVLWSISTVRYILFVLTPNLTELTLKSYSPFNEDAYIRRSDAEAEMLIMDKIPHLKRLDIRGICFLNSMPPEEWHQLLSSLFQSAVELNHLTLEFVAGNTWALQKLLTFSKHVVQIKILEVIGVGTSELQVLTELAGAGAAAGPLQLNELHLHFDCSKSEANLEDLTHTFLTTQSPSLDLDFRLMEEEWSRNVTMGTVQIPRMAGVKCFRLRQPPSRERLVVQFNCPDRMLSTALPDLTRLDVSCCKLRNRQMNLLVHPGVKQLIWGGYMEPPRPGWENHHLMLRDLGELFPSVVHCTLKLDLGPELFAPIWSMWPAVRTLNLNYEASPGMNRPPGSSEEHRLDEWLTGIPALVLKNLRQQLGIGSSPDASPAPLNIDHLRELHAQYKTAPGISDLKHLEKFCLHISSSDKVSFTGCKGYFGLALASNTLRHMEIASDWSRPASTRSIPEEWTSPISAECQTLMKEALDPQIKIEIKCGRICWDHGFINWRS